MVARESLATFAHNASVERCTASNSGGAVFLFESSSLFLRDDASIRENSALNGGGIMIWVSCHLDLVDRASIISNTASISGGAVLTFDDTVTSVGENAVVAENSAFNGGAFCLHSTAILIVRGTISNNAASRGGGGARCYTGGSLAVYGGSFVNNTVAGSGGGAHLEGMATIEFVRGTLDGNIAFNDGGGLYVIGDDSRLRLVETFISRNYATNFGGGIRADGDVILHAGTKLSRNSARCGGGVALYGRIIVSSTESKWVQVEMNFAAIGSLASESRVAVVDTETRSPYDMRGQTLIFSAVKGSVETKLVSLPTGKQFSLEGYSGTSIGWGGGIASYSLVMEAEIQTGHISVPVGIHAEKLTFLNNRHDGDAAKDVLFENNIAALHGGGLWMNDETSGYVREAKIRGNRAHQGAGIFVSSLATAELANVTLEGNTATSFGGSLFAATLSTMSLLDCLVQSNKASSGAGAYLDTTNGVYLNTVTFAKNSAVEGGAVYLFKTESPATFFVDSIFWRNQAISGGAGIYSSDSIAGLSRCQFIENIVTDGYGAAVYVSGPSSAVEFFPTSSPLQNTLIDCARTTVHVITDWSSTTARCEPILTGTINTGNTCDYWQSCSYVDGNTLLGIEADVCKGCACFGGLSTGLVTPERYFLLVSEANSTAVEFEGARAAAIKVDSYCLQGGRYTIQAIDTLSDGWFHGHLRVVILPDFAVVEGVTPFSGAASAAVEFDVPESSLHSFAQGNQAPRGGGAVVFSEKVSPMGTIIDLGQNTAKYGNFSATLPVSIVRWDNSTTTSLTSGEMIENSWIFALLDQHDQIVTSDVAIVVAFARVDDDSGATVVNNIAEFKDGFAVFDKLIVSLYPGSATTVRIESQLDSLEVGSVAIDVRFRECRVNEFVQSNKCVVCEEGQLLVDGLCRRCDDGFDCKFEGNEVTNVQTKAGFYRLTTKSLRAYHCFVPSACPHNARTGHKSCREGHEGHTCSSCSPNHYITASGLCRECDEKLQTTIIFLYAIGGLFATFGICWLVVSDKGTKLFMSLVDSQAGLGATDAVSLVQKMNRSGIARKEEKEHDNRVIFFVKMKMMLTFAQLSSTLPAVLGTLKFPSTYLAILQVGSVANLNFLSLIPSRCLTSKLSSSVFYVRGLVATTATPILFALFLHAVYRWKLWMRGGRMPKRERLFYTEAFMLVAHLVLTLTSVASFQVYVCETFDVGDGEFEEVLRAERTINCASTLWRHLSIYAGLMVAIYPVGIPVLYAVLLYSHREQLNPKKRTNPLLESTKSVKRLMRRNSFKSLVEHSTAHQLQVRKTRQLEIEKGSSGNILAFRFLWSDYSCAWFWWELVESSRRIFLSAVLSTIAPGSTTQITWGFLVSIVYAIITMLVKPFLYTDDNILVIVAQLCTTASMFVALVLKTGVINRAGSGPLFITIAFIPIAAMIYALRTLIIAPFLPARLRPRVKPTRRSSIDDDAWSLMRMNSREHSVSPDDLGDGEEELPIVSRRKSSLDQKNCRPSPTRVCEEPSTSGDTSDAHPRNESEDVVQSAKRGSLQNRKELSYQPRPSSEESPVFVLQPETEPTTTETNETQPSEMSVKNMEDE